MKINRIKNKIFGIIFSIILLGLIFTFLLPPVASIELSINSPSPPNSRGNSAFTFSDVNITIKNVERIPILDLNFTIFKGGAEVDNVKFDIFGSEKSGTDPNNRFTVTLISPSISDDWYTYGYGYDIGYGYRWGLDNFGYGYGYGDDASNDVTLSYKIVYNSTATRTSTYQAKLFVNTSLNGINYTYVSNQIQFKVTISVYSGGGGTYIPNEDIEETNETKSETKTLEIIDELFNIVLVNPFYANDTDGDGLFDSFHDPNNVLKLITTVEIDKDPCFLISIDNDSIPEFYWNPITDTITLIQHNIGIIKDSEIYSKEKLIYFTFTIEKSNWTYIEVKDLYDNSSNISIQTSDGRYISSNYIWKKNNKIFILDDPAINYYLIYPYNPEDISIGLKLSLNKKTIELNENLNATLLIENKGKIGAINATLTYTISNNNTIYWTESTNILLFDEILDIKTIPIKNLTPGNYTLTTDYECNDEFKFTTDENFNIKTTLQPQEGVPLIIFVIGLIIAIIISIILFFLFKYKLYWI